MKARNNVKEMMAMHRRGNRIQRAWRKNQIKSSHLIVIIAESSNNQLMLSGIEARWHYNAAAEAVIVKLRALARRFGVGSSRRHCGSYLRQ
jgi:hypothetical protein